VLPTLHKLRIKAVTRVRAFLLTRIADLRKPRTNVQMVQEHVLLRMKFVRGVVPLSRCATPDGCCIARCSFLGGFLLFLFLVSCFLFLVSFVSRSCVVDGMCGRACVNLSCVATDAAFPALSRPRSMCRSAACVH